MAWGSQALQDQLQRSEQAHQATVRDLEAQIEQGERRLRAATAEAQAGIERELLVEVRVREAVCDAASPGISLASAPALEDRVTLLFTPPEGVPSVVVLADDCSFLDVAAESACIAASGDMATSVSCVELGASDVRVSSRPSLDETAVEFRFPGRIRARQLKEGP